MATAEEKLTSHIDRLAISETLDPRVQKALKQIPLEPAKLLALRNYIREGQITDERWVWTKEQNEDFKKKREYETLMDAVKQVQNQFATANPGYTLNTNKKYRTLERQISLWNQNDKVQELGAKLVENSLKEIADYPETPTPESLAQFRKFLKAQSPKAIGGSPTNATPGLSDHGHLDAFDFVVMKGSVTVAGTSTQNHYQRTNWDEPGWTEKLKNIIETVNGNLRDGRFEGPLHKWSLYEPWHYTYKSMTQ